MSFCFSKFQNGFDCTIERMWRVWFIRRGPIQRVVNMQNDWYYIAELLPIFWPIHKFLELRWEASLWWWHWLQRHEATSFIFSPIFLILNRSKSLFLGYHALNTDGSPTCIIIYLNSGSVQHMAEIPLPLAPRSLLLLVLMTIFYTSLSLSLGL